MVDYCDSPVYSLLHRTTFVVAWVVGKAKKINVISVFTSIISILGSNHSFKIIQCFFQYVFTSFKDYYLNTNYNFDFFGYKIIIFWREIFFKNDFKAYFLPPKITFFRAFLLGMHSTNAHSTSGGEYM